MFSLGDGEEQPEVRREVRREVAGLMKKPWTGFSTHQVMLSVII